MLHLLYGAFDTNPEKRTHKRSGFESPKFFKKEKTMLEIINATSLAITAGATLVATVFIVRRKNRN